MKPGLLPKAIRAFRAGRLGDAAAYKSAALTAPAYPEVERLLGQLDQPLPQIDLDALQACAAGTFGHAYAAFMAHHMLTPIVVSPAVAAELARSNLLAVRYPLLHDAFHVLLGFDTSLAGELGVWSFVAAQRYSPSFQRAAAWARFLYPLTSPSRWQALREARLRGLAMGQEVPCLIAQPIEAYWQEPLSAVRARFNIEPSAGAERGR